ncbi:MULTISPECIES: winged helix-turn-helix domain-containing protein [Bacillus cereus group]|uniref:winged helix-turn-helix domain-containing protein n=1 Tax=Bacillus cereus group TaxID=86661 RepID=UPI0021B3B5F0|nr:winged helix-turn-helix domain-containing protein [Bacillus thuringiensis]MEB8860910.1 winged helix-turn-helix domain-containing protein [Bacillus cereus]MEB9423120.1 winged helix-turn-helix domain-containing protein [Bacillus cereus]
MCREYDEFVLNPPEHFIKVGELIFYPERLEIHLKKRRVTLTYNETIITEILFSQYPRTVTHKELSSAIQRNEGYVSRNTLYKNIVRVNKKFDILGFGKAIKVVSKIGYRLNIKENI